MNTENRKHDFNFELYQVAPEFQESPIDNEGFDIMFPNVIVTGNKDFAAFTTDEFDEIMDAINHYDLDSALGETFLKKKDEYVEVMKSFNLEPCEKFKNAHSDMNKFIKIAYKNCKYNDDLICLLLYVITGIHYTYGDIRGNSQSEWQCAYIPEIKDDADYLEWLAACYFNTGVEFIVREKGGDEHSWYDINRYSIEELKRDFILSHYSYVDDEDEIEDMLDKIGVYRNIGKRVWIDDYELVND